MSQVRAPEATVSASHPSPRKSEPLSATTRRGMPRALRNALLGVLGLALVVVAFEIIPRVGLVDARFLPPFSEIMVALFQRVQTAAFWVALGQTLFTWASGLLIAMVAGVVLGVVIGGNHLIRDALSSTIEFLRPIPSVALIPIAVLMLGTGMGSTLLLVVYAAFWQVLIQVIRGVESVDPVARDTTRVYQFGSFARARSLVWPSILPYVVTGFRLAATVALILTITGELIIGTPGIGKLLGVAQQSGAVAAMYAFVIVTGVLGVLVNVLARAVERRALHWHPSIRREVVS